MTNLKRGVALCTYNRAHHLEKLITRVLDTMPADCKLIVCDDSSTDNTSEIVKKIGVTYINGINMGVSANKNRALWALQDCHMLCILEDDLFPKDKGWFEIYEEAASSSGIHHFCRVQDKEIPETIPAFTEHMSEKKLTPIYGPSPRGDLTFLTSKVLREVGGFNPNFKGAGYAHGEWTQRVVNAGLIMHPLKYVDIKEARDKFEQIGDTTGGRWNIDKTIIQNQISHNRKILKNLQKTGYIYHPLILT